MAYYVLISNWIFCAHWHTCTACLNYIVIVTVHGKQPAVLRMLWLWLVTECYLIKEGPNMVYSLMGLISHHFYNSILCQMCMLCF